jgi:hypothetical protein
MKIPAGTICHLGGVPFKPVSDIEVTANGDNDVKLQNTLAAASGKVDPLSTVSPSVESQLTRMFSALSDRLDRIEKAGAAEDKKEPAKGK